MKKFEHMPSRAERTVEKQEPAEEFGEEFIRQLSQTLGEKLAFDTCGDTYEVDTDTFGLTFTLDDGVFEIRNIDTRGNAGVGGRIISAIHEYADANKLEVIASNVKSTAYGFWEKMGYAEKDDGEWYRAE